MYGDIKKREDRVKAIVLDEKTVNPVVLVLKSVSLFVVGFILVYLWLNLTQ